MNYNIQLRKCVKSLFFIALLLRCCEKIAPPPLFIQVVKTSSQDKGKVKICKWGKFQSFLFKFNVNESYCIDTVITESMFLGLIS